MRLSLGKTVVFLSTILSLALLTGCSLGTAEMEKTDIDVLSEKSSKSWEQAETMPLGKYPELVTYTLGQMKGANNSNLPDGQTYEDNAYTRYLKKTLNIQNKNVFMESEERYDEALNILVKDRNLPDIFLVSDRETLEELVDLLIYGKFGFPEMGVRGAAVATVLSRYVEACIVLSWTHKHTEKNIFAQGLYSTLKVPANLTKKILIKGTPLLLNETLWAAGVAMLTQCYSVRGLNVVAGLNISNTINNVFNIIFIALGDSVAIVVGQLLGAGKMKEARDTDNKMIAFSVFCCTCVAAVMFVMAPLFPRLYNTNAEARTLAKYFIMLTAFFMPQNAFLHATYFTLRSGGKTIVTFLFDSVFIWVVSVTIAFTLSRFTGLPVLVIYAMVQAADMMKCVIGFILVKKGVWLQNIVS